MFNEKTLENIPIAHDSAGDIFYLDSEKKVYWIMIDNLGDNLCAEFIAENFLDFVDNVCLGTKYLGLYSNNEWYQFLKSQGWA